MTVLLTLRRGHICWVDRGRLLLRGRDHMEDPGYGQSHCMDFGRDTGERQGLGELPWPQSRRVQRTAAASHIPHVYITRTSRPNCRFPQEVARLHDQIFTTGCLVPLPSQVGWRPGVAARAAGSGRPLDRPLGRPAPALPASKIYSCSTQKSGGGSLLCRDCTNPPDREIPAEVLGRRWQAWPRYTCLAPGAPRHTPLFR